MIATAKVAPISRVRPALPRSNPGFDAFDVRRLCVEHEYLIHPTLLQCTRPGVAILAFGPHYRYMGWLDATLSRTPVAVVGSHSSCDIKLPSREMLAAPRHLAIIAHRGDSEAVQIRVIDLLSGVGFGDPDGHTLHSATAERSFFFSIGRYQFALFVTGGVREDAGDKSSSHAPAR